MVVLTVVDRRGNKHRYEVVKWSILPSGWVQLLYKTGSMYLSPEGVYSIYQEGAR